MDSQGRVVNTWADMLNHANLGMEVMHERNAHNFPLDLAASKAIPVALQAMALVNQKMNSVSSIRWKVIPVKVLGIRAL